MSVALWAARLERPLTEGETETLLRLLPPERAERVLRVKQASRRREPLCAYLILRRALWEQYRLCEIPRMAYTELGKPWFPDHPEICFNLSHTDGAVLAALSDRPVGVDIERLRPLTPRARERLTAGETETDFFRSWVRREARAKRSGVGVGAMLRAEPPLEVGEACYTLDTFPGYAAGVAVCGGEMPEPARIYTLDELLTGI